MRDFFLQRAKRYPDVGLLILRVLTAAFLIHGVLDNVLSAERMEEFAVFLAANDFPRPDFMAPISVYVQLFSGLALGLGFMARWAGIVIAIHFGVALVMVHWAQDFRGWWPALALVGIGLQYTLTGAGRISLDQLVGIEPECTGKR